MRNRKQNGTIIRIGTAGMFAIGSAETSAEPLSGGESPIQSVG